MVWLFVVAFARSIWHYRVIRSYFGRRRGYLNEMMSVVAVRDGLKTEFVLFLSSDSLFLYVYSLYCFVGGLPLTLLVELLSTSDRSFGLMYVVCFFRRGSTSTLWLWSVRR